MRDGEGGVCAVEFGCGACASGGGGGQKVGTRVHVTKWIWVGLCGRKRKRECVCVFSPGKEEEETGTYLDMLPRYIYSVQRQGKGGINYLKLA